MIISNINRYVKGQICYVYPEVKEYVTYIDVLLKAVAEQRSVEGLSLLQLWATMELCEA